MMLWGIGSGQGNRPGRFVRLRVEAFGRLPCEGGDSLLVLIDMQHRQARELSSRGDDEARYRGSAVHASIGKQQLHLKRAVITESRPIALAPRRKARVALSGGWVPS